MKKIICCILIFLAVSVQAGRYNIDTVISTTLDTTTTATDSSDIAIFDNVGFRISYNETETDSTIQVVFTFQVGTDDDWTDFNILLDNNGTDAPQANVTFTADGTKYVYFPTEVHADKVKITATATGTAAAETAAIVIKRIGWRQ